MNVKTHTNLWGKLFWPMGGNCLVLLFGKCSDLTVHFLIFFLGDNSNINTIGVEECIILLQLT